MVTVTIDVIPISLMGEVTIAFPVLMLLTYRLYLQIVLNNWAPIIFPMSMLHTHYTYRQYLLRDLLMRTCGFSVIYFTLESGHSEFKCGERSYGILGKPSVLYCTVHVL